MISAIIPVGPGDTPAPAIRSLAGQAHDLELIVSWDPDGRGANWARNRGAAAARGQFLLFSDADVEWEPGAVKALIETLARNPAAAYAYGSYEMGGRIQCDREFDPQFLRRANFISTMSLIRRQTFPGFDEAIPRLQDWELWLTMLARGHSGAQSGKLIFRTAVRKGITSAGPEDYESARQLVSRKHGLGL